MPTNGVQPLWMILQISLAKLFPQTDDIGLLSMSLWASHVLFAFLAGFWLSRGRQLVPSLLAAATLAGLLILNVRFHDIALLGLEVPLALCFLVMTMLMVDALESRYDAPGAAPHSSFVLLALLACGCLLSRTDLSGCRRSSLSGFTGRSRGSAPISLSISASEPC